ncbi:NusG domain II-containing protein [Fusibacter bizertensis]|uniref:NusG domain II-containing protein n=1 Tax=Fusibacter bizertensis TaxID=1488331 RepID=A0ABT6NFD8_9FIRM|nr:NusG domain II-containing protein [Fusibacter bizertensis]MDH8679144.1 NusG domain II-containing protein [Fusibacter bizertensis]
MKKNDVILMGIILIVGLIALFAMKMVQSNDQSELQVLIKHDGVVIQSYPFTEKTDETYVYEEDGERNVIQIKDGLVSMIDADCRDQICVKTQSISNNGEIIVCLPHKVTVEIFSDQAVDDVLDDIAD